MRKIRDLKRSAREAMFGRTGTMVGTGILVFGLTLAAGLFTGILFPGSSVLEMVLSHLFSIIISLILSVITAGYAYIVLSAARGNAISAKDLGYFLRRHPDRVIVASTVLVAVEVLTSLPSMIYSFSAEPDLLVYEFLMLSGTLLHLLVTLPLVLFEFLLVDNLEMGGIQALKTSASLMKGKKWKYFCLCLSFIPLLLGCIIALGVPLLWVYPYMQTSFAEFYRDAIGENTAELPLWERPYDGERYCTGVPADNQQDSTNNDDQSEA